MEKKQEGVEEDKKSPDSSSISLDTLKVTDLILVETHQNIAAIK